jgi:hypothetical protein
MIFLVKTALGEFQTALSRAKTDGQIFVKKKGPRRAPISLSVNLVSLVDFEKYASKEKE